MNINYRDKSKPITAEDLIRRYNLDGLAKDRKAIQTNKNGLDKTDTLLNEFVENTTQNIQELQDQVDGKMTTWFFSGVPTLENQPANEWVTEEDKKSHIGDLYYDKDTGKAYRWIIDNDEYIWLELSDNDLTEVLALANAAKDTADSKRRVFVEQPFTPYDVGDIWIREDTDLYRCRASRSEGDYEEEDFILATNYTDDSYALSVEAILNQFRTNVEGNYVTKVLLESTAESINMEVSNTTTELRKMEDNLNENYYVKSQIEKMVVDSTQGVTNTFSEAGGNNVLRNTNFSATDVLEEGQYYEFWYGNAMRLSNNNSANGYSVLLKTDSKTVDTKMIIGNPIRIDDYDVSYEPKSLVKYGLCKQETIGTIDNPVEISTVRGKIDENGDAWLDITVSDENNNRITSRIDMNSYIKTTLYPSKELYPSKDLYPNEIWKKNGYLELCSVGDVKDELDLITRKLIKRIGKIESYNGESITTDYISTTGGLDIGATIYYVLENEVQDTIPIEPIKLFNDYNRITDTDDLNSDIQLVYLSGIVTTLTQNQVVANGKYTLSFYYKKLNPLANCTVNINGREYALNESEWTLFQTGITDAEGNYIVEPIEISNNFLSVIFRTDIDDACEIYDIMCNAGSIRLTYSQNANETITDTVNISKGITITSSESKVKFTANNDGIRTKTLNNEIITEFTDIGMNTKKAEIKDEAIIVGILRQKVGDQVWDSLI